MLFVYNRETCLATEKDPVPLSCSALGREEKHGWTKMPVLKDGPLEPYNETIHRLNPKAHVDVKNDQLKAIKVALRLS